MPNEEIAPSAETEVIELTTETILHGIIEELVL